MIVDVIEIERCLRYFKSINEAKLTEIVWVRGNEPLTPEPYQLEEYKFMGLCNRSFPEVIGWMPDDISIRVSTMFITKATNVLINQCRRRRLDCRIRQNLTKERHMENQQLLDDAKADNGFEVSTRASALNLAQNLKSFGYVASSQGIKLLADEFIEMDAELTKKSSAKCWISCADILPNISDNVLVYRDDDEWQVVCFFTTDGRFMIDLDTEAHAITHWMPTPEPPNV